MEPQLSIMDVAMKVKASGRVDDLAIFFLIAWSFWFRQNKMVHDQKSMEPINAIDHVLSLQKMFTNIKVLPTSKTEEYFKWKPPPLGLLKLNIDGIMFSDIYRASVDVILFFHIQGVGGFKLKFSNWCYT